MNSGLAITWVLYIWVATHYPQASSVLLKAPLTLAKVSTVSNHTPFHLYDCDFLLSAPRITIAGREPWVAQSSYRHLKSWATGGRRGERRSGEMKGAWKHSVGAPSRVRGRRTCSIVSLWLDSASSLGTRGCHVLCVRALSNWLGPCCGQVMACFWEGSVHSRLLLWLGIKFCFLFRLKLCKHISIGKKQQGEVESFWTPQNKQLGYLQARSFPGKRAIAFHTQQEKIF